MTSHVTARVPHSVVRCALHTDLSTLSFLYLTLTAAINLAPFPFQVELEREYSDALSSEKALLERAVSAERQLDEVQEALQREHEQVQRAKQEAAEAAFSAQRQVRRSPVACTMLACQGWGYPKASLDHGCCAWGKGYQSLRAHIAAIRRPAQDLLQDLRCMAWALGGWPEYSCLG